MRREEIYAAVEAERLRQDAKWGEQNHPDVDRVLASRKGGCTVSRMAEEYGIPMPTRAKAECDGAARQDQCTWAHILVEEVAELVEAATLAQQGKGPEADVDAELVQTIAVLVAWREARARRGAA